MKRDSIKKHLNPYSIEQKRSTTINHAFASAIAPVTEYNLNIVNEALISLGQDPNSNLSCIFCGRPAETWDHLVGLVKNSELRGYGHQLGNLVPCCKDCNSKKGGKEWQEFIQTLPISDEDRLNLRNTLDNYTEQYAKPINLDYIKHNHAQDWDQYTKLRHKILSLMREADEVAKKIRSYIVDEN